MQRTFFLVSTLPIGIRTAALADEPGPDWISEDALTKQLQAQGYTGVSVEADGGRWEGHALKDGKFIEFHADPKTGAVIDSKPDDDKDTD